MKIRSLLVCTSLYFGLCSAAVADWSGFYIGPQLSYSWSTARIDSISGYPDGFTIGPHVGWTYEIGSWVLGMEGVYTSGSWSDEALDTTSDNTYKTSISQLLTVTPLFGYAYDHWLLYAKGGYASGKVEVEVSTPSQNTGLSDSDWQKGWTAGAGVEYEINDTNALGLEYSFVRLNSGSLQGIEVEPINMNAISFVYTRYFW